MMNDIEEILRGKKEIYREVQDRDGVQQTITIYDDGSTLTQMEMGEPFKTYFELSDVIVHSKNIHARLAACEDSYKILGEFVRAWLKDSTRLPDTIACRDIGVELYLRLGKWFEAGLAIGLIASVGAYEDGGQSAREYLTKYRRAAEAALKFLRANPGFLQKNIYRALPEVDRECLKSFTRSSLLIRKEKFGGTNKLYVKGG